MAKNHVFGTGRRPEAQGRASDRAAGRGYPSDQQRLRPRDGQRGISDEHPGSRSGEKQNRDHQCIDPRENRGFYPDPDGKIRF